MTGQSRLLLVMCLSVAALVLPGCASVSSTVTAYIGAPHPPPTSPANVQILRTEPTRPHDKLGEIVVDASTQPAPPIGQVEDKLRSDGASLGADAVVIVLDRVQPVAAYVTGPYWGRSIETVTGQKVVGIAIKWR